MKKLASVFLTCIMHQILKSREDGRLFNCLGARSTLEGTAVMPPAQTDLTEYADTKISIFIFNPLMHRHAVMSLTALQFTQVTDNQVPRNYFQALSRLIPILSGPADLILIDLPPKTKPGQKPDEVVPIYDQINEAYLDLKTHLSKRSGDPLKFLSKTIPIIEVGDYLREKLVEILFKYRVPAAFFMSAPESSRGLKGPRKDERARENFQVFFQEFSQYLSQYFRDKDQLVALASEKISERELSQRKKKYDELMAQAAKHKEQHAYDESIALLRQAIDVFPKDIEAYLESGRLYIRVKEYGRALSRFSQAEELFVDAPSPNKEIANVRLSQVKEKVEAGVDPNSPEIMELLNDAVANFEAAHQKSVEMSEKNPESPNLELPSAIGQEILKWNMSEILGPKHRAVKALFEVANKSTEGLENRPLEDLTTMQLISLGLASLESGDVEKAEKYYFHALEDRERFAEVCTEINYLGIRLRKTGRVNDAVRIYNRLVGYKPPNLGSVFWNMAIAHALNGDTLNAGGFAARCLYTDPYIARENEFYESLTSQLAPVMTRLIRTLRIIMVQAKKITPPPGMVKLYQARDKMIRLIAAGQNNEALQIFLTLLQKAPKFTVKPEFHGDGQAVKFLAAAKTSLAKSSNPKHQSRAAAIDKWLHHVSTNPAPKALAQYLTLSQQALTVLEDQGDQHQAAFFLGQALMTLPESYFGRPDFFARQTLSAMAREMAVKLKYVDVKKFPRFKIKPAAKK